MPKELAGRMIQLGWFDGGMAGSAIVDVELATGTIVRNCIVFLGGYVYGPYDPRTDGPSRFPGTVGTGEVVACGRPRIRWGSGFDRDDWRPFGTKWLRLERA